MINYRKLLLPSGLLLILVALYGFVGKYLLTKVFTIQEQIKAGQNEQIALQRKLVTLQESSANFEVVTEKVVLAVPATNPILNGIAQIRKYVGEQGATINNLSAGQISTEEGLQKVSVTFDIDSGSEEVFAVIDKVSKSAPLSAVSKFSYTKQSGTDRFSLVLNYYWAPLPNQIPAVSESLGQLTADDQVVLSFVSGLNYPTFDSEVGATIRGSLPDRTDPFESGE